MDVNSPYITAGTDYDQLVVNGTVNMSGATITLTGTSSTAPTQRLILISTTGTTAGTTYQPAGTIFALGGYSLAISYASGTDISNAANPDPNASTLIAHRAQCDGHWWQLRLQ